MIIEACCTTTCCTAVHGASGEAKSLASGDTGKTVTGGDGTEAIGQGAIIEGDMGGEAASGIASSNYRRKRSAVFGGFASGSPWRNNGKRFSGDGRSFLFSFDSRDSGQLRTYTWSGADRSFMTSDDAVGLGMGSGGHSGSFGFFVESDLRKGSTGVCETFNNDPLMSPPTSGPESSGDGGGTMFDVTSIEVWGFRHARRLREDSSTRTLL